MFQISFSVIRSGVFQLVGEFVWQLINDLFKLVLFQLRLFAWLFFGELIRLIMLRFFSIKVWSSVTIISCYRQKQEILYIVVRQF